MLAIRLLEEHLALLILLLEFFEPLRIRKLAPTGHVLDLILQLLDLVLVPQLHRIHLCFESILHALLLLLKPFSEQFFLNFELVFVI